MLGYVVFIWGWDLNLLILRVSPGNKPNIFLLLLLVGDDVSVDARLDLLVLGVAPLEVSRVGGVLTQKFLRIN